MNYLLPVNYVVISLAFCLFMSSCKKDEGKGGKSSISGKIIAKYYDKNLTVYTGTGPAQDVDVFLIYGDQAGYGDKATTDYSGAFEFKYLQKGSYKVYVYSKDTTNKSQSLDIPVVMDVNVDGDVSLADITIVKDDKRNLDIGPYKITGRITAYDCDATFSTCKGPYNTVNADVYLVRGTQPNYSDKVTTYFGGLFTFDRLPDGNYTVYAVSKNQFHISDPTLPKDTLISKAIVINGADMNAGTLEIIE